MTLTRLFQLSVLSGTLEVVVKDGFEELDEIGASMLQGLRL
jgi:hypothetical protein